MEISDANELFWGDFFLFYLQYDRFFSQTFSLESNKSKLYSISL